jgi:dicarboxylate/amino acid:cation (Na+ or H+) symporter, DAACS family
LTESTPNSQAVPRDQAKPHEGNLHTRILLALVVGAVAGSLVNFFVAGTNPEWLQGLIKYVMDPLGQIFLRMLFMTVIPLVFASLALGVAQLGGGKELGRIGLKTFGFFLVTMSVAVTIGLGLVNTINPGKGLAEDTRVFLQDKFGADAEKRAGQPTTFGIETLINVVPRNPLKALVEMDMLAVICFALFIGVALTKIPPERATHLMRILEGINDLMIVLIGWAMRLAPFGVFALIFTITAQFGFQLLQTLGWYVAVVLIGLSIQMFVVMPLLLLTVGRYSPQRFFKRARPVLITAFSTSSSSATLPTSIKTAEEELGVHSSIAGFVLPLGATMNMNGTALFEGVTVMFLAQVFGVDLTLTEQLIVVILSVMTSVGAAGVPGGSLPLLALVLNTVHVPSEGIALILGVDRLLDMCRTTLNATGDVVATVCVARSENLLRDDLR